MRVSFHKNLVAFLILVSSCIVFQASAAIAFSASPAIGTPSNGSTVWLKLNSIDTTGLASFTIGKISGNFTSSGQFDVFVNGVNKGGLLYSAGRPSLDFLIYIDTASGSYSVKAQRYDAAFGYDTNVVTGNVTVTATVPAVAPAVSQLTARQSGSSIAGSFTVTDPDSVALTLARVQISDNATTDPYPCYVDTSTSLGTRNFTVGTHNGVSAVTGGCARLFATGTRTLYLKVEAMDAQGNKASVASTSVAFRLANVSPVVSGLIGNQSGTNVTGSFSVADTDSASLSLARIHVSDSTSANPYPCYLDTTTGLGIRSFTLGIANGVNAVAGGCARLFATGTRTLYLKVEAIDAESNKATVVLASTVFSLSATSPVVTGVTPLTAVLDVPTVFTVTGTNLTSGMGFTIANCEFSNSEVGVGTGTQRSFQCTPRRFLNSQAGVVKASSGGASLYTFNVTVSSAATNGCIAVSNNPCFAEVRDEILQLAKEKNVPPVIVQAIAFKESGWKHFLESASQALPDPECALFGYVKSNPVSKWNCENDGRIGVGLMQITLAPSESEFARLDNDWKFNLRKGTDKLLAKWAEQRKLAPNDTGIDIDPTVIENWYYPVMWYNGEGNRALAYANDVFAKMGTPPEGMGGYWDQPGTLSMPSDFVDLANQQPYTLAALVNKGVHIHQWNAATGRYTELSSLPGTASSTKGKEFATSVQGTNTHLTPKVTITPAASQIERNNNGYLVGALANGMLLEKAASGWRVYGGGELVSLGSLQTLTGSSISVLEDMDVSQLGGTSFFAGYGVSFSDMLTNGSYQHIYTISTDTNSAHDAQPPSLGVPTNGQTLSPGTGNFHTFNWSAPNGVEAYRIVYSENASFSGFDEATDRCNSSCLTYRLSTNTDSHYFAKQGTTYYWRVRSNLSGWSEVRTIRTSGTALATLDSDIDNFVSVKVNTSTDMDGYYGAQCVDLMHAYISDVLDITYPHGLTGNAYAVYESVSGSVTKQSGSHGTVRFDKIANTAAGAPQKGDIVFWSSGAVGHVAIFLSGDANSFQSIDQNWINPSVNYGSPAKIVTHSYSGVAGWLHPVLER